MESGGNVIMKCCQCRGLFSPLRPPARGCKGPQRNL